LQKYRQITSEERYAIAALRRRRLSLREISRELGRAPSTISREIRRNRRADGGYRAQAACEHTSARRRRSRRNERIGPEAWRLVEDYLRKDWSPDQVAGYLRGEGLLSISHETIYVRIWADKRRGGDLYQHLRQAGKKRRKRYGAYDSRGRLPGKRHISERPAEAETRCTLGHWEIDTVMGTERGRNSVVTMVERSTGYLVMGKLGRHCARDATRCITGLIQAHPGRVSTITADNGTEFHSYREIEEATGTTFYFATPHHSWERGTNENTNGLVRQYLPKKTSFAHITQEHLDQIAAKLNARPRKRLGYQTPEECYVQGR
jgi:transposase, IS30 family